MNDLNIKFVEENGDQLATAYHEAGHYIISVLFKDKLYLNRLSANKNTDIELANGNYGSLHLEYYVVPKNNDLESADNLILISVGGICSRTIFTKGKEYVKKFLDDFSYDYSKIDVTGASVDLYWAKKYSKIIRSNLTIDYNRVLWSGIKWTLEFMLLDDIFNAINNIVKEILDTPEKTLNEEELVKLYNKLNLEKK